MISKSRSMESLLNMSAESENESSLYESSTNLNIHNHHSHHPHHRSGLSQGGANAKHRRLANVSARFIAEIEEVRINPVVSKKGFLNFLEEKSVGWSKKFVVSILDILNEKKCLTLDKL